MNVLVMMVRLMLKKVGNMKIRKHHNNKGTRGIKTGSYSRQLKLIAKKLNISFKIGKIDK
jgi:hypothetical protein